MQKIKLFIWYLDYTFLAMRKVGVGFRFAWSMATAQGSELFDDGYTPADALDEELSYWGD